MSKDDDAKRAEEAAKRAEEAAKRAEAAAREAEKVRLALSADAKRRRTHGTGPKMLDDKED